ncbi:hypothetical protein ACJ5NV_13300 [Loktanella agnita]
MIKTFAVVQSGPRKPSATLAKDPLRAQSCQIAIMQRMTAVVVSAQQLVKAIEVKAALCRLH